MRKISYTCDKCGKPIMSRGVTKLNITIQRGTDSVEKKTYDFCTKCFLKMKKIWTDNLSITEDEKEESISKPDDKTDSITTEESEIKSTMTEKLIDKTESVVTEELEKPVPKKRGRKPKPVIPENPEDWMNRIETASGSISAEEKRFILKLYVEDGLLPHEIAAKLHRLPKGINQAINAASKSGELDKLKASMQPVENISIFTDPGDDTTDENTSDSGASNSRVKTSSYVVPANIKIIDGRKYDVGGVLALHKAGWQPSEIAKEKNYDEDIVRIILEEFLKNIKTCHK